MMLISKVFSQIYPVRNQLSADQDQCMFCPNHPARHKFCHRKSQREKAPTKQSPFFDDIFKLST